jgi:hypothetical protein
MRRDMESHLAAMAQAVFQAMADAQAARPAAGGQDGGMATAAGLVQKVGESVVESEPAAEQAPSGLTNNPDAISIGMQRVCELFWDEGFIGWRSAAVRILSGGLRMNISGEPYKFPGVMADVGGGHQAFSQFRVTDSRRVQVFLTAWGGWNDLGFMLPGPGNADGGEVPGEYTLHWTPGSGGGVGRWTVVKVP